MSCMYVDWYIAIEMLLVVSRAHGSLSPIEPAVPLCKMYASEVLS